MFTFLFLSHNKNHPRILKPGSGLKLWRENQITNVNSRLDENWDAKPVPKSMAHGYAQRKKPVFFTIVAIFTEGTF